MSNGSETLVDEWNERFNTSFEEPYSFKVLFAVSLLIVSFASLIGNILTCIVIYYDKSMHTAVNYYLFNLAVSDLLLIFPVLLISYEDLSEEKYILKLDNGIWSCKLILCIHYLFISVFWNNGILVMTALSIERYIAICYPMVLHATSPRKRVSKIIYAIWMIAIIEAMPLFWTMNIIDTGKTLMCFSIITSTAKIIIRISFVATFILPFCIMIFVYTMIVFKVKDKEKYNLKFMSISKNGFRAKHVSKSIVALTASFVICWLPMLIMTLPVIFTNKSKLPHFQSWFMILQKIAMFSSFCTTALNPVIFSFMSIKFRKSLKTLWKKKQRRTINNEGTKKQLRRSKNVNNVLSSQESYNPQSTS